MRKFGIGPATYFNDTKVPVPLCFFLQLAMKQVVFIYHDIIQYLMAVIISETEINTFGLMTVKMETLFGGV